MSTPSVAEAITCQDVIAGEQSFESPMMISLENPRISLDDPATYDLLTDGATTDSGIRVSERKALTHPAVWQAVTMISGDVAGLPLELFQLQEDGDRIRQDGSPVYDLVHWKANSEMTAFKFWRRMIAWRLLWNNAYAWVMRRGDGTPIEMTPLLPDRTTMERSDDGRVFCVTEVGGKLISLPSADVIHLEGISIDNLAGFEFIKAARDAIGLGLAEINFASKFFKNGGRQGGILELPASMKKDARDRLETGFRKTYESSEAFKTVILRENAKFHSAQTSPKDTQVVEGRQESVRDIARFFNVRPGKLGEESRTSFASKSEDNRDYHDTTLRPHCRDITQECREKLLTKRQKEQGFYLKHDTREFLTMDFKSMSEAISVLISGEVLNPDEGRALLNMNKREDGRGGEYRNPNINTTPSDSNDSGEGESDAVLAFRKVLSQTIGRMASQIADRAKKKSVDLVRFRSWIDDQFFKQRTPIVSAIQEITDLASDFTDVGDDCVRSVTDKLLIEAQQTLSSISLAANSDDELQKLVAATMQEWAGSAGPKYASQIFPEGNP